MTELYEDLPSFDEFSELTNKEHYAQLPKDWNIIIAYVVDAEATDNHRQVNSLGGGCITAVKNALKEERNGAQVPYVFNGTGATFAVPPCCYDLAVGALLSFRKLVQKNFKSDICIGSISVEQIEKEAKKIVEVARYEIAHGVCIALFRGGGLAYASTQVGCVSKRHVITDEEAANMPNPISQVSLEGLSCRWTPIPSKYGAILSLLVYENPERSNSQTYSDVLQELDHILDFDRSNPAHMDRTKYRSFGQIWSEEKRFGVWHRGFGELIQFCLSIVIFRWGLMKTWLFDSDAAKATLRTHADYRKFDDMLRLVVDCTPDQAKAIEFVLQDRFNQGHLFYGIFSSTHAIMTCLVEGLGDGEHIHFMDGADGGYTLAGKALREQMESAAEARANRPFTNTGWSATPSSSDSGDKEYGIRLGDGPRSSNDDAVSDILGAADHDKSHSSSSTTPSSMGGLVKKFDSMKELETPVQFDPVQEYDEENQEELLVVEDTPDPTEEPFHDDDYEDDKEIGTSNKSHSSATSSSTTASSTGVAWVEKFDSMKEEQAPPAQFDPIQFDPNEEELVVDDTIIPTNSLHEFDEEDEEELGRSKKSSSKKKKSKKKKKKKSKDTAEQSEPDLELGNSRKSESSKESSRKKSKKAEKKKASKKASRHDEEETLRAQ